MPPFNCRRENRRHTRGSLKWLHRPAFTLIELLVVISIVSLLIGIVAPGLMQARSLARRTLCATRMNQTATLLQMYTAANKDYFPRTQDISYGTVRPSYDPSIELAKTWVDLLVDRGYIQADLATAGVPTLLTCPSSVGYDNDPTWAGYMPHYGVNSLLSPPKQLEATVGQRSFFGRPWNFSGDHSKKIFLGESKHLTNARGWYGIGNIQWIAARHDAGSTANVVYLDGHVAVRPVTALEPATQTDGPFASITFWRQAQP